MLALRYTALLAVAVWLGGLLVLGAIAAPSTFDVTAAGHVSNDRILAGAIFGEMLKRFHKLAYLCGGVLLASIVARKVLGPTPRPFAVRVAISSVMLATTLYSGLVVSPRIEQLQRAIGAPFSSLPPTDARRATFGRLHGLSIGLQVVPIAGGLLIMFWELRD
jgi:Domain of unknown function (DUF4149)